MKLLKRFSLDQFVTVVACRISLGAICAVVPVSACLTAEPVAPQTTAAEPARKAAASAQPLPAEKAGSRSEAAKTPARQELLDDEIELFDGKTLKGWRLADFAGKGEVKAEGGKISLGMGYMTGIVYTGAIPRMNYEVTLEAMRVEGSDFFCGLTFPVATNPCSLVVGGWGGGVVGLSSLDGEDASSNETTKYMTFQNQKWYKVRLRVTPGKIQAWIDDEKVVDVSTKERGISIRIEMEPCLPLGIATWSTAAALRHLKIQKL